MSNTKTNDATVFYSMCALLKTAQLYGSYLTESKQVHGTTKMEINAFNRQIHNFLVKMCEGMPDKDRTLWMQEWNNKDFQAVTNIMTNVIDMNDYQRSIMEEFTEQLKAGKVNAISE